MTLLFKTIMQNPGDQSAEQTILTAHIFNEHPVLLHLPLRRTQEAEAYIDQVLANAYREASKQQLQILANRCKDLLLIDSKIIDLFPKLKPVLCDTIDKKLDQYTDKSAPSNWTGCAFLKLNTLIEFLFNVQEERVFSEVERSPHKHKSKHLYDVLTARILGTAPYLSQHYRLPAKEKNSLIASFTLYVQIFDLRNSYALYSETLPQQRFIDPQEKLKAFTKIHRNIMTTHPYFYCELSQETQVLLKETCNKLKQIPEFGTSAEFEPEDRELLNIYRHLMSNTVQTNEQRIDLAHQSHPQQKATAMAQTSYEATLVEFTLRLDAYEAQNDSSRKLLNFLKDGLSILSIHRQETDDLWAHFVERQEGLIEEGSLKKLSPLYIDGLHHRYNALKKQQEDVKETKRRLKEERHEKYQALRKETYTTLDAISEETQELNTKIKTQDITPQDLALRLKDLQHMADQIQTKPSKKGDPLEVRLKAVQAQLQALGSQKHILDIRNILALFEPSVEHRTSLFRSALCGHIEDPHFKFLFDQIYRETASVGDGGTAAILCREVQDVSAHYCTFPHYYKSKSMALKLSTLEKERLSLPELAISHSILHDFHRALDQAEGSIAFMTYLQTLSN